MSARNSKNVIQPKYVRIGNQVVQADAVQTVEGRNVTMVIASKTADFRTSHRELTNGALIGTIKRVDGPLTFNTVGGETFELSATELAGVTMTLQLDYDLIEDILDELAEYPAGNGGGKAAELSVMIDTVAALSESSRNDGGVIGKVISTAFTLTGVSREKEVTSKDEALTQLQSNLKKNRGVQEESRRRRMAMPTESSAAGISENQVPEAALPPVVA